jgi:hypothetical protein
MLHPGPRGDGARARECASRAERWRVVRDSISLRSSTVEAGRLEPSSIRRKPAPPIIAFAVGCLRKDSFPKLWFHRPQIRANNQQVCAGRLRFRASRNGKLKDKLKCPRIHRQSFSCDSPITVQGRPFWSLGTSARSEPIPEIGLGRPRNFSPAPIFFVTLLVGTPGL